MGCDGGTIPKRDELVRTKKKTEQKDRVSELNFLWRHCSISQTPLKEPIVACGLGKLYNKESVILGILDKTNLPEKAKHIKSIKDVKELNLTTNPAFSASMKKGDGYDDHQNSPYICPLVGIEMNGKFKFCFSWSCGCVLSERAMKELKSSLCHKCQKPISDDDIVFLNATGEDLESNKNKMEDRQAKAKAEKKLKKMKLEVKVEIKEENNSDTIEPIREPKAGSSTNKKMFSEKKNLKRPAVGLAMQTEDFKKTKENYSVATDPGASTVYKSLFTSSNEAQNQERAHWITYNPFYN